MPGVCSGTMAWFCSFGGESTNACSTRERLPRNSEISIERFDATTLRSCAKRRTLVEMCQHVALSKYVCQHSVKETENQPPSTTINNHQQPSTPINTHQHPSTTTRPKSSSPPHFFSYLDNSFSKFSTRCCNASFCACSALDNAS